MGRLDLSRRNQINNVGNHRLEAWTANKLRAGEKKLNIEAGKQATNEAILTRVNCAKPAVRLNTFEPSLQKDQAFCPFLIKKNSNATLMSDRLTTFLLRAFAFFYFYFNVKDKKPSIKCSGQKCITYLGFNTIEPSLKSRASFAAC